MTALPGSKPFAGQPFLPDTGIDLRTGRLKHKLGQQTFFEPLWLEKGCVVRPASGTRFRYAFYAKDIRGELIHTYCYDPEANWTTYKGKYSGLLRWRKNSLVIRRSGYYRFIFPQGMEPAFDFSQDPIPGGPADSEVVSLLGERLREVKEDLAGKSGAVFFLLADSHYAAGCNWATTAETLRLAATKIRNDGIIHLGDLTDGLTDWEVTRFLAGHILEVLRSLSENVMLCLGNHDRNYFRGNTGKADRTESSKFYLEQEESWYCRDYSQYGLRLLFLDSFEPERSERYGFSEEETEWFAEAVASAPPDWKVLVLSHVTPVASMHVWSETILNGPEMLEILRQRNKTSPGSVLGWICGHNHADQTIWIHGFPVISIGCSKTEDFEEHKPGGSVTQKREPGTVTQELWEILAVDTEKGRIRFYRIGAGEDRNYEQDCRG